MCQLTKMIFVLMISLQVILINSAPMQWLSPLHQPMMQLPQDLTKTQQMPYPMSIQQEIPIPMPMQMQQQMMKSEQLKLEQQMLALQQWQTLQNLNAVHGPMPMSPLQQPLLIIIPNQEEFTNENELAKSTDENTKNDELKHDNKEHINEDLDSVIIDSVDSEPNKVERNPPRAILLLPDARFSIGGFISSIPWLPFEVNVPDTIAWGYNGISNWISGIISIIGQRLPFRRPPATTMNPVDGDMQNNSVKMYLTQKKQESVMPIIVVPLGPILLPMQG